MRSMSAPASARMTARLVATVVLPDPPLMPPHTTIMRSLPHQTDVCATLQGRCYAITATSSTLLSRCGEIADAENMPRAHHQTTLYAQPYNGAISCDYAGFRRVRNGSASEGFGMGRTGESRF